MYTYECGGGKVKTPFSISIYQHRKENPSIRCTSYDVFFVVVNNPAGEKLRLFSLDVRNYKNTLFDCEREGSLKICAQTRGFDRGFVGSEREKVTKAK